jgi:hypothetical protein
MQQNHILEFTILRDMSSMQLVGYIEFAVVIKVDRSVYQYILKRIYHELQEYLMFVANVNQSDLIFAVDSILTQRKHIYHTQVGILPRMVKKRN